jgi:hypothetical protein
MIFAYHSSDNPYFKGFTGLSNQFPNSLGNLSFQNPVAIFRHPNKVILDLKNCMTTVSVFHNAPLCVIIAAKADRLKPVV